MIIIIIIISFCFFKKKEMITNSYNAYVVNLSSVKPVRKKQ